MGTHPIFESDFDCLTVSKKTKMALCYAGRIAVPSTSKQSLHDRFTSFMKNRPSKLDVVATPAKASDRNQRLAAEMESRESVKHAIHHEEKRWNRHHPYGSQQGYQRGGGRKTKQPKVIPDQSELDAELDAYNKGREKKAKQDNASETADPLNDSKDDDILKDSNPAETNETEKTAV